MVDANSGSTKGKGAFSELPETGVYVAKGVRERYYFYPIKKKNLLSVQMNCNLCRLRVSIVCSGTFECNEQFAFKRSQPKLSPRALVPE